MCVCVQDKEQFPACTFLTHTALLVQLLLLPQGHTFEQHIALD